MMRWKRNTKTYFAVVEKILRPECGKRIALRLVLFSMREFVKEKTRGICELCMEWIDSVDERSHVNFPANGDS